LCQQPRLYLGSIWMCSASASYIVQFDWFYFGGCLLHHISVIKMSAFFFSLLLAVFSIEQCEIPPFPVYFNSTLLIHVMTIVNNKHWKRHGKVSALYYSYPLLTLHYLSEGKKARSYVHSEATVMLICLALFGVNRLGLTFCWWCHLRTLFLQSVSKTRFCSGPQPVSNMLRNIYRLLLFYYEFN